MIFPHYILKLYNPVHLVAMNPSIRNNLNYRKMAALVALGQDSHILTLTGLSLDIRRLVGISHMVLVLCFFGKKKAKQYIRL